MKPYCGAQYNLGNGGFVECQREPNDARCRLGLHSNPTVPFAWHEQRQTLSAAVDAHLDNEAERLWRNRALEAERKIEQQKIEIEKWRADNEKFQDALLKMQEEYSRTFQALVEKDIKIAELQDENKVLHNRVIERTREYESMVQSNNALQQSLDRWVDKCKELQDSNAALRAELNSDAYQKFRELVAAIAVSKS